MVEEKRREEERCAWTTGSELAEREPIRSIFKYPNISQTSNIRNTLPWMMGLVDSSAPQLPRCERVH